MTKNKQQSGIFLEIGKRLVELREKCGMNQATAADTLKILRRTYQNYEYGLSKPNTSNLKKIVDYYGCSTGWLLAGEGVPYPDRPATNGNAVAGVKGWSIEQDIDMKCLRLSMDATRIHQEETQTSFSPDKSANLSYTLYKILIDQIEAWQTEEGVQQILQALLKISQDYEVFRKLNMDVHATPAFLRFIIDPEKKV